jgi:5-methylcytosine-specific restriction enzyme A
VTNRKHYKPDYGRWNGRKLTDFRKRYLERDPLCAECKRQGRIKLAEEIDHIIPLHKGGTYEDSNLQGLCKPCHQEKTAADMGVKQKVSISIDGWPETK